MGKTKFVGHYGTIHKIADGVIQKTTDLPKETNRLGFGIYFFEKNIKLAQSHSQSKAVSSNVAVLEADILVEDDFILDVTQSYSDGMRIFSEAKEDFEKSLEEHIILAITRRQTLDGMVFDKLHFTYGYHVVRACAYVRDGDHAQYLFSAIPNRAIPNGISLCVKEPAVIGDIIKAPMLEYVV